MILDFERLVRANFRYGRMCCRRKTRHWTLPFII